MPPVGRKCSLPDDTVESVFHGACHKLIGIKVQIRPQAALPHHRWIDLGEVVIHNIPGIQIAHLELGNVDRKLNEKGHVTAPRRPVLRCLRYARFTRVGHR